MPFESKALNSADWWSDFAAHSVSQRSASGSLSPEVAAGATVSARDVHSFEDYSALVDHADNATRLSRGNFGGNAFSVNNDYRDRRWNFVSSETGVRYKATRDSKGRTVIGAGFVLDRPDAPDVFERALGVPKADFKKYVSGDKVLSDPQARRLFDFDMRPTEDALTKWTQENGRPLNDHERLSLIALKAQGVNLKNTLNTFSKTKDPTKVAGEMLYDTKIPLEPAQRLRLAKSFIGADYGKTGFPKRPSELEGNQPAQPIADQGVRRA